MLGAGADKTGLNAEGRTAVQVAACPDNPCKRAAELRRVVALLEGEEELSTRQASGASKGLFQSGEQEGSAETAGREAGKLSGQAKPGAGGPGGKAKMAGGEEAAAGAAGKEEDVYEFKTSSKEATPASSRGSASPGTKEEGKEGGGEAGKRGKEEEGEEGGEQAA